MIEEHGSMELFRTLQQLGVEEVPKGWKTASQFAEEWKLRPSRVNVLLRKGVESGILEKRNFSIIVNNSNRSTPHYREIQNKKKSKGK